MRKILVYDNGLNTELAIKLASEGNSVAYCTPWTEAFPKSSKAYIGRGLEGIEVVESFTKALDKCDCIVCPDTFSEDRVLQARKTGKPTWGAGQSEELELNRPFMKDLQRKLRLPVGPYTEIHGIEALIKFLRENKDCWIKSSKYRQIETFHHDDWESTKLQYLGPILDAYGPTANDMTFIAEDPLKGQEIGFDMLFKNDWILPYGWGYEKKDEAYIGTCSLTDPPKVLSPFIEKLGLVLKESECQSFVSNEVIVTDKDAYMIEPTIRCPHPPTAGMLEMYSGFSRILTNPEGERINVTHLKMLSLYCAVLVIRSSWAGDHWLKITIKDEKYRRYIKLSQACRIDGNYYAIPGNEFIAYAVGIGPSVPSAVKMAKEIASNISCRDMDCNEAALDFIMDETIPAGKKLGIYF